jgi:hypothetical protein
LCVRHETDLQPGRGERLDLGGESGRTWAMEGGR